MRLCSIGLYGSSTPNAGPGQFGRCRVNAGNSLHLAGVSEAVLAKKSLADFV